MAFQNLRNGNTLFILHKDLTLEEGKVTQVAPSKYGSFQGMIVDVEVNVNDRIVCFEKLPANFEIADDKNKGIVVSCTREAMSSEISAIRQDSLEILNSVEFNQNRVKKCDELLSQINPEIAERQRQENETKALKEQIDELKDLVKTLINSKNTQKNGDNRNS